jgi:hypothetical protein
MRLGFQHLRATLNDIVLPDGSDPLDVFISHEMFVDTNKDVKMCLRDGCDLQTTLSNLYDGLASVTKYGLTPDLCSFIAVSVGMPTITMESLWDGIKTVYQAIKDFIVDLIKRFINWIKALWTAHIVETEFIKSRLKLLCTDYRPDHEVLTLRPVTNLEQFKATIMLLYRPNLIDGDEDALGMLQRVAMKASMTTTIRDIYGLISDITNTVQTVPPGGGVRMTPRNGMNEPGNKSSINRVVEVLTAIAEERTLDAGGWTPIKAVNFAKLMVDPTASFENNEFKCGQSGPLMMYIPNILQRFHNRVINPELVSVATQYDSLIKQVTKVDGSQFSKTIEDEANQARVYAVTATNFVNAIGTVYSSLLSFAIRMLTVIEVQG